MTNLKNTFVYSTILASSLCASYSAFAGDSLEQAFRDGTPYIDMRYRYEFIDQDSKTKNANASTLRTRLGYRSGEFHNFSGVLEFENIVQVGSDSFNDTVNKKTMYPTVADVEGTELNQAFLQFTGIDDTRLRVGREAINIGNQRFIGSVEWRQNNQTFDAISLVNQSLPDTVATYAYLNKVHRIFGDDSGMGNWNSSSHIINAANKTTSLGTISGYGYFLDFDMDAPAVSSKTYGISLDGKQKIDEHFTFKYYLEYAHQSDHGSNTTNYDAQYYHIAPAISFGGFTGTLGYEVLGSDNGVIGFSTPLATGHKFNGAADKFLSTPAGGLEDAYIELKYKVKDKGDDTDIFNGLLVKAQYHDFSAEHGSADYGTEFDLYVKKPIAGHFYAEAGYAIYDADTVSSDTQKFTLGIGVRY
ncbi:MAG: alginate export family protein [Rickettsiales bacterium]